THAGRGFYNLEEGAAAKTKEAEEGVKKLLAEDTLPGVLQDYVALVRSFAPTYPGSPLVAAKLKRDQDRLVAIEKHDEEYAALAAALEGAHNVRTVHGDGYRLLPKLMPPPERRGLVLIDPPYEEDDEFATATAALVAAHRRFATGIFVLWYP